MPTLKQLRPAQIFMLLLISLTAAFALHHYTSRVGATALAPFIVLQEAGLTLVQDGKGLANWDHTSPVNLTVNVGGAVRFALLYWNGRDRPCTLSSGNCTFSQPFKDQQVAFNGTPITGTVIGTETQPATSAGPTLNIGYYADVTSIVSAAGTGNKTFTFADGNTASNLTKFNGVTLFVAYTDAANPQTYRVLVWDGLDFAFGDDPTPGDPRTTAPITFNHGSVAAARPAELYLAVGGGTPTRPDNVTISNNATRFNTLDGSAGPDWDSEVYSINIPANIGTTTVQVNSSPAGSNPDELLWQMAALRIGVDAPPSCSQTTIAGPPSQVQHNIQDADTGLASIVVTNSSNADTVVPPFTVGTTAAVIVTSTKIDQSAPMCVEIRVTDVAGNVSFCNYCEGLTISKNFGAASIAQGGTTSLSFTLSSLPSSNTFTNVSFTDALPSGLVVASPNGLSGGCGGGTINALAGGEGITLSGATLASGASCTFSVNVTGRTSGTKTNTVTATASNGAISNTATATLNVNPVPAPTIAKTFGAANIPLGGTTSLTLTITNPSSVTTQTGIAFTDTLPPGLAFATPTGLTSNCGGVAVAVAGPPATLSLSGGTLSANNFCTVTANVTGTLPGAKVNNVQVSSTNGGTGNTATATLTVGNAPFTVSIADPFGCTGPGDALTVTVVTSNPTVIAQSVSFTASLPAGLVGVPGSGTSTVGAAPAVTATTASFGPMVLAAGQSVIVTYQVQVGDVPTGTTLTISTAPTFGGVAGPGITANATINCPGVGPGALFPSTAEISDQKAGSVLIYNYYTSDTASPAINTRLTVTNTNPSVPIAVHLFFVDGSTCSIADAFLCLTQNQTVSFLASDYDPGTSGYVVAVASDVRTGCPSNFNFLIGDEFVKSGGFQANLGAEAIAALAGGLPTCDGTTNAATLNFDGVSYNRLPRVLAADNLADNASGNATQLIINRIGGNLLTGADRLGTLFGLLYDDIEQSYSFQLPGGTCQVRGTVSGAFPRTVPRIEQIIPAGRSGWLKLNDNGGGAILGAQLVNNSNSAASANAFRGGHNLHKLTLAPTASLTIPVFAPNCRL